jgi:hypothetical protein
MERFKALSGMNFAYLLVLALMVKALVADISYPIFLLTIPILTFEGYKLYIKSKQPDPVVIDAEVRKELDNIKSKLNATTFEKGLSAQKPVQRYF